MPSLLSPTPNAQRSYTPLSDELNPPFGNHAPTVTRNGTVVYGKRSSSYGSETSDVLPSIIRTPSEETLPGLHHKGKGRDLPQGEEDIGILQRQGAVPSLKGKERAWDPEMGREEIMNDSSYPPINQVEDEERRVQENLAKFAARDMARRRAARLSRTLSTHTSTQNPSSSSSSTTSYMRRPFSLVSSTSTESTSQKRSSVMGILGNWGQPKEELPISSPRNSYNNPYDPPQRGLSPTPRMVSPTSQKSPFDDPPKLNSQSHSLHEPNQPPYHRSSNSISSPDENVQYGYAGPEWHGGSSSIQPLSSDPNSSTQTNSGKKRNGEKWWHALCAWGNDLDGGHGDENEGGNQAGRTNPFE